MGGCGFWFALYFVVTIWICMTLNITSAWAVVLVGIVVMFIVCLLRVLIVEAFQGQGSIAWVFRIGFLILLCILIQIGATGWFVFLVVLYLFLEFIVSFS